MTADQARIRKRERDLEYVRRLKLKAAYYYGDRCQNPLCQATYPLEYAHIKPTKLNGRGRGSRARYTDILRNLDKYMRLCRDCHLLLDAGLLNLKPKGRKNAKAKRISKDC